MITKVETNIYRVQGHDEDFEPGFYYEDETQDLNGPFGSANEARAAMDEYVRTYLS